MVILFSQGVIIGVNDVLDIIDIFDVINLEDNLGVDGELLDHLEEAVEDTNKVDGDGADGLDGDLGSGLVSGSSLGDCLGVDVTVLSLLVGQSELADMVVVLHIVHHRFNLLD